MPIMRIVTKDGEVRDVTVEGSLRDKPDVEVLVKKAVLSADLNMADVRRVSVKPRDN